ncbi:MAG TPA: efflux RND transporter permease subunit, partial [Kiritimatiellia bacterium]
MIFSEVSIKRPVFAAMMNLALLLFGLVAIPRLPVRELPDIDPPIVNVGTVYPGASAQVVETEVTERLEEAINSVEGIKSLRSESREQYSSITVEFDLARPIEVAAQDVRDRVSRVRGELPEDIEEPIIAKQDADAQAVIWIALYSDEFSTLELTTMAENFIKDRLQTVKGVSSIILGGRKRFAMRLRLDAEKMAAHQVTVLDIEEALRTQNVELPSGRVESFDREMTIQTRGELKTPEEFNNLVIRRNGDAIVHLHDIGVAETGVEDERSIARYNSKPAVGLGIVKQSKANTIEVARGVKEEMGRIMPQLPAGVQAYFPYDESIFVEASIKDVWFTLGIAFILVIITIFIFLRNARSTLIPCLTVPVSIIGTFAVLMAMGYSINILTMMALVLAIGIVVDDSIVVLENIYRHMEEGLTPMEASLKGMREIGFAIIAITFSLIAVFIPLAFQSTITGRLLIEFAFALCGSVVISAFVALSLTPMASARLLKPVSDEKHGRVFNFFERFFERLASRYDRTLAWALRHRVTMAAIAVGTVVLAGFFYLHLPREYLPEEDKGSLLALAFAPEGATSEYTDRMVAKMESMAAATPEIAGYFSAVALAMDGPGVANMGIMFMRFKDERDRSLQDVIGGPMGLGSQFFTGVEGAFAIPIIPKAIGFTFGQPFQLVVQNQDLEKLNEEAQGIVGKLSAAGFLMNVRTTYELNKPELRVNVDRDRAAALGISVEDLSRTLQVLFGGLDLSRIKLGGKEYQVIAQLDRRSRMSPTDLDRLYVRNDQGQIIQLSSVVQYESGAGPNAIHHYNR